LAPHRNANYVFCIPKLLKRVDFVFTIRPLQRRPPAENICSNIPENCDQKCTKLKKKLNEQKYKFIQDMFLILNNII
jgi:hypothetical protein